MTQSPHSPSTSATSGIEAAEAPPPDSNISLTEFKAFAGKDGYPERWVRYAEGKARLGFNFWAFWFGIQWFFFRKLYIQGVVILAFELGIPFLAGVVVGAAVIPPENQPKRK